MAICYFLHRITVKNQSDPNGKAAHEPGAKLDSGKPLGALIADFGCALERVVDIGTYGANKYSRGGWQTVPEGRQRYMDAFYRHLLASHRECYDQESEHRHLHHALWNLLAVVELEERGKIQGEQN